MVHTTGSASGRGSTRAAAAPRPAPPARGSRRYSTARGAGRRVARATGSDESGFGVRRCCCISTTTNFYPGDRKRNERFTTRPNRVLVSKKNHLKEARDQPRTKRVGSRISRISVLAFAFSFLPSSSLSFLFHSLLIKHCDKFRTSSFTYFDRRGRRGHLSVPVRLARRSAVKHQVNSRLCPGCVRPSTGA